MNIEILGKTFGPVETNCFIAIDIDTRDCLVFDAPLGCESWVRETCKELRLNLRALMLTHSHWDHTADAATFSDIPIFIDEPDNYRLVEPMKYTGWPLPFTIEPVTNARFIGEEKSMQVGSFVIEVLRTPGHTEGGVCFQLGENVIVGDTIFKGSVGRTDLPGGDYQTLMQSIKLLVSTYAPATKLYPGHGPNTTVEREQKANPFVREALL